MQRQSFQFLPVSIPWQKFYFTHTCLLYFAQDVQQLRKEILCAIFAQARTLFCQCARFSPHMGGGAGGLGGCSPPVFAKFLQNLPFLPQILAFLCLQPPHVPVSLRTFKFTPPSMPNVQYMRKIVLSSTRRKLPGE